MEQIDRLFFAIVNYLNQFDELQDHNPHFVHSNFDKPKLKQESVCNDFLSID